MDANANLYLDDGTAPQEDVERANQWAEELVEEVKADTENLAALESELQRLKGQMQKS